MLIRRLSLAQKLAQMNMRPAVADKAERATVLTKLESSLPLTQDR